MKDTLDQPEEKRLSGLDLRINRYHLVNPDEGELMIQELRSAGYSSITVLFIFGGIGCFFLYLSYHYYMEEGTLPALLWPMAAGIFMFGLVAVAIYGSYFSKSTWHFTATEFINSPTIGRKRTFRRDDVKSVFIQVTNNYQNGAYISSTYFVCLKLNGWRKDGRYPLMHISAEDIASPKKAAGKSAGIFGIEAEAEAIADCIAKHWNIPLSI